MGLRALTGAVAGLSWLLISNHCTIISAAPVDELKQAADPCPMHASAPKHRQAPPKQPGDQLCCKNIHATAAKLSPARILQLGTPVLTVFFNPEAFSSRSHETSLALCLDTGPPLGQSFSELVLQRSLLAHAPPVLT